MGIIKYNLRMSFAPTIIEAALAESIAVPNSMQFTQTAGFQYFIMDNSQTYGSPDPPQLNNTEMFTLGGIWNMPVTMSYVEFKSTSSASSSTTRSSRTQSRSSPASGATLCLSTCPQWPPPLPTTLPLRLTMLTVPRCSPLTPTSASRDVFVSSLNIILK